MSVGDVVDKLGGDIVPDLHRRERQLAGYNLLSLNLRCTGNKIK